MNNKFENDLYIKKYGHNYHEYESLKFFNFPNSECEIFCENIITLKIKTIFVSNLFILTLVSLICSIVLFSLLSLNISNKKNILIISGSFLSVISFIVGFISIWKFLKLKSLVKEIELFKDFEKIWKKNSLSKIYLIYKFTFFNFLFFGIISSTIMFLNISKIMDKLSKNYQLLNLTKKTLDQVKAESNSNSSII